MILPVDVFGKSATNPDAGATEAEIIAPTGPTCTTRDAVGSIEIDGDNITYNKKMLQTDSC